MSRIAATTPHVAIACGGTGGHLFPGIAVARELASRGARVSLLVSPKEVDQQAVQASPGFQVVTLPAVALQRGSRLAFFSGFARSYFAAGRFFKAGPAHAALAMGGFTGVPPVLAAKRRGAKTFLHESNTVPGRANRILARFVDVAFVGFPEAAQRLAARRVAVTGTPVRSGFRMRDAAECRRTLGLDPARPVVLVMGGSQGARGVNDLVIRSLPLMARSAPDWQWLHLAGANDSDRLRTAYAAAGLAAIVQPFSDCMEILLAAADAAVTRAGASSLAELAAMRLPAVLVPLPTAADNHQFVNASAFERDGAARLLQQATATPEQLLQHLRELVLQDEARGRMRIALARWHVPDAARDIAATIWAALPACCRPELAAASATNQDGSDGAPASRVQWGAAA